MIREEAERLVGAKVLVLDWGTTLLKCKLEKVETTTERKQDKRVTKTKVIIRKEKVGYSEDVELTNIFATWKEALESLKATFEITITKANLNLVDFDSDVTEVEFEEQPVAESTVKPIDSLIF